MSQGITEQNQSPGKLQEVSSLSSRRAVIARYFLAALRKRWLWVSCLGFLCHERQLDSQRWLLIRMPWHDSHH